MHHCQRRCQEVTPGQGAHRVVERHLEGRRPDHENHQRADEPPDGEAEQ